MERRDFLRGMIAAAITVAVAPFIPGVTEHLPLPAGRMMYSFKVSNELLSDPSGQKFIEDEINRVCQKYPSNKVGNITIGYAGGDDFTQPDFALNMQTCVFELIPA